MKKVAVIMGSDSDWNVMEQAVRTLRSFNVETEVKVLSAHRTPEEAGTYAAQAEENGIGVMIAAAGMAAHLAGALAARSVLPVIGVPIVSGALGGVDALLSTVQMPPGVPVATVGTHAAQNAAVLAVQILALSDPVLNKALHEYKSGLREKAVQRDEKIAALAAQIG